jgi:hypothetical protein
VISAVDWESDGSLGSQTVPVTVDVTNTTDTFPCPVGKSLVLMATEYTSCLMYYGQASNPAL